MAEPETSSKDRWSLWEFVKFAIIAAVIVLPIRFFIAEPFLVRGDSMVPTFKSNDYLIVEKIGYRFNPPKRGEVVILISPVGNNHDLIKRIVGLPNEKVEIADSKVFVTTENGKRFQLNEPYVKNQQLISQKIEKQLGNNEYFVLGDNRPVSYDSRYWGALDKKDIIGRPFLRLYRFDSIGFWPGTYSFNQSANDTNINK
jgi:signal peptidase I